MRAMRRVVIAKPAVKSTNPGNSPRAPPSSWTPASGNLWHALSWRSFASMKNRTARRRTLFERLEARTLRSGGSVDYHDVAYLTIGGTSGHDDIAVTVTDWTNPNLRDWHVDFNGES